MKIASFTDDAARRPQLPNHYPAADRSAEMPQLHRLPANDCLFLEPATSIHIKNHGPGKVKVRWLKALGEWGQVTHVDLAAHEETTIDGRGAVVLTGYQCATVSVESSGELPSPKTS